MKLDLKSSLTVVFFIGFALFFAKWWLEGDSYRKENKKLQSEIEDIQHTRDSLKAERAKIDLVILGLEKDLSATQERIARLDEVLAANKKELKSANDRLNNLQKGLNETKTQIQELKANPVRRTGASLINSIKDKTK